jgi:hypothetical protein
MSFGLVPVVAKVASDDHLADCVRKKFDSLAQNANSNSKRAESP